MSKHRRMMHADTTATILALLHDTCAEDYLPRQLAEECAELNIAALKCIRANNGETPADPKTVYENYLEELADVSVMLSLALEELPSIDVGYVNDVKDQKQTRMISRLRHTQRKRRDNAHNANVVRSATGGGDWSSDVENAVTAASVACKTQNVAERIADKFAPKIRAAPDFEEAAQLYINAHDEMLRKQESERSKALDELQWILDDRFPNFSRDDAADNADGDYDLSKLKACSCNDTVPASLLAMQRPVIHYGSDTGKTWFK